MKSNKATVLVGLIAVVIGIGCSRNLFADFANKTSDEALLFDAKTKMNSRNWTAAIATFQLMSATALATREVKAAYAGAYAGRCGLDMVSLTTSLASSSANLFLVLMQAFQGAASTQAADCVSAQTLLRSISTYASGRTTDENTLMAFIALTDIGVRLAASADASPANGTVDAGWDSCTTNPFGPPQGAPGTAADAGARQIGVDFNLLVDSLSAPGMPSLIGTVQSQISTLCSAMFTAFPTYAICGGTGALNLDTTVWTNLQVSAVEGLIRSSTYPGLGVTGASAVLAPAGTPGGGAFCL